MKRRRWPIINRKATAYLVYCDADLLTQAPVQLDQAEHLKRTLEKSGHVAKILAVHTLRGAPR